MAELLVRAKNHWMDDLSKEEVDSMSVDALASYKARSQKGDVIVVRPDGWPWGKEECLPNFVIVKVPDISIEEAKKYEEPLIEKVIEKDAEGKDTEVSKLISCRKYSLPKADIENQINNNETNLHLSKSVLISKISEKNIADVKDAKSLDLKEKK